MYHADEDLRSTPAEQVEQVLQRERETEFCRRHFYRPFHDAGRLTWCAHLLFKKPCPYDIVRDCRIPDILWDHPRVYRDDKGHPVLTLQPYIAPKEYAAVAQEATQFAARWNLYFRISNEESWWNPGRSILIEFWGDSPKSVHFDANTVVKGARR